MAYKDRSLAIPYAPLPPPIGGDIENYSRATWAEFEQIRTSLVDLDQPNCIAVTGTEPINVTAAISWQRLLNAGTTTDYENPGGTFDGTTGIYTCPQEGLYQVTVVANVAAFTTPANKEYYVGLRATLDPVVGPDRTRLAYDGGMDSVPKQAMLTTLVKAFKGDTIYADITAVHATKTGTVDCTSSLQIIRISAT